MRTRNAVAVAALLLPLVLAACDETPVVLPEASSVTVAAADLRLTVGDLAPVPAQVLDQKGRVMQGLTATYASDNPAVASVDANGTVRGVSPGTATISVAYGSSTAAVKVTVQREERGQVKTLDLLADSVAADVRIGTVAVSLRAFDGFGQPVCPAVSVRSSDPSVATGASAGACRVTVTPQFAGVATLVVQADGAADSVRVRVTSTGAVAFLSTRPQPAEVFAGNTVTYAVRLLDAQEKPVAGRLVHFDATAGELSATSASTDSTGTARVQWTLPKHLDAFGSTQTLSAGMQLSNGNMARLAETVAVRPGPAADITLFRYDFSSQQFIPIAGDTMNVRPYEDVYIGAKAVDQYGNSGGYDFTFSVTGPAYLYCGSVGYVSNGIHYSCAYGYSTGVATYTATTGGRSKSVTMAISY